MQGISRQALFTAWKSAPADAPVLCATRRLADDLVRDYARQRHGEGATAWRAPDCRHWRAWLTDRYAEHALAEARAGRTAPRLLSDAEARTLWRAVVEDATRNRPLLQTPGMSRLAAEAWQSAHDYDITLPLRLADDEDASAFDAWTRTFRDRLHALGAVTGAELPALLAESVRAGTLAVPGRLVIAALDRTTPAQQALLDTLAEAGSRLERLTPDEPVTPAISHQPCRDPGAELDVTARAIREHALRAPDARIGVVVPDLGGRLDALRRRFDAVLCPWLRPEDDPARRPYAVSQGDALAVQPVVATALAWLDWACSPGGVAIEDACRCLRSPYWLGAEHPAWLAGAEHTLRDRGFERVTPATAARALEYAEAPVALSAPLRGLVPDREQAPPSVWSQRFAALLDALHWPGVLDSAEFQAQRAWNEALGDFARTDAVSGRISARAALSRLRDQLNDQPFQPQGGDTRIQVMGLLEAAGQHFDTLHVLGMDETAWPPGARPVALIPETVQRAAGVPQASADGQLARARAITGELLQSAPDIVLSWATTIDEQPARLSPLLPAPGAPAEPAASAHPPAWQAQRPATEGWQDARAQPPPPGTALRGGERRLGEHAECPFRALAHHALAADAPAEPEPAPDARERGVLAHEIMAAIWRRLGDSTALGRLDAAAQRDLVGECVDACLDERRQRAPHRFSDGVVAVESVRMQRHANALLDADRARAPFHVEWLEGADIDSDARRRDHELTVHGVPLRVRPDRVDLVPGFGRVVIDYKTGRAASAVGNTLSSPQLAVYAELVADCVGVAYAVLRAGDTGYAGLIDNDSVDALPALTPVEKLRRPAADVLDDKDWPAVRRLWDAQLAATAAGLRAGDARVAPLAGVCRRCDLQPLCRIHARDRLATADDGDAA
ncbi:PD-(D/E)XK nuclease family protein [Algiphilus sp.]|uniref:PD-(D/E)XK nuclease family protein n=1 Tax=Algiphilus sp. TaxID=1872431 RepID=UPI0025BB3B1C|nr:PD-(D/E)XK nuclease family protein [Algiphilus sp.]MCK5768965.1 PD-(D/E)XK nuclease family protein [Algiphilus sp.]